jgi:hypothetical protein
MNKIYITFFDIKGTARFEFIPQSQRDDQAYCVEISKPLHEAVSRRKSLNFGHSNDWIIHHENASAQKSVTGIEHPWILKTPKEM